MTISGTTRGKMQINMEKRKFKKTYFQKAQSKKNRKVHLTKELGPSVTMVEVQAQQQTDHVKAVAGGPTQVAGATRCGRNPPGDSPVLLCYGGCTPPCIGRFHLLPYLDQHEPSNGAINWSLLSTFQSIKIQEEE